MAALAVGGNKNKAGKDRENAENEVRWVMELYHSPELLREGAGAFRALTQ